MGRGRAKAKQTKVARELKYHSPNTDLAALQRELGGNELSSGSGSTVAEDHDDDERDPYDPYANYAVDDDDDDDDGKDWTPRR
ncbi:DUF3073 domain-containing protein [Catellatospora bangladeshensis]|uniref:DUF3073 domain-containing protein n=1 Tax=Catellatospora bangladeshensis TaxID=310355 RepID=A0A8J3JTS4_9ACTN|nr:MULTISPECIES: DUF3073 domain-containing protein [Catellatospora]BCJ71949.1 hypothetical protein CS0771_14930 [Catellatospora sp. IY07-71]GIF83629.1 hypothetical protein Cba03nite_49780 [Catellatospora bangladeshensis]